MRDISYSEYQRLHGIVRRARGSASRYLCELCRLDAARDWATIHGADGTDPIGDYAALCLSCHKLYDATEIDEQWHIIYDGTKGRRKTIDRRPCVGCGKLTWSKIQVCSERSCRDLKPNYHKRTTTDHPCRACGDITRSRIQVCANCSSTPQGRYLRKLARQ